MTTRRMSKELSGKLIVSFGSLLIGIGATKLPNVSAWFSLLAGIGVFAWGFFVEKKVSGNPSQVRTEKPSSQPAQQREILVMCISTGNSISPVPLGDDLGEDLCKLAEQKRDCHVKGEKPAFWSWEQPLRGIFHNLADDGPLKRVILLGSPESVLQINEFKSLLDRYDPFMSGRVQLETFARVTNGFVPAGSHNAANGFDFDDFNQLSEAMETILEKLRESGVTFNRIQIDFTGGMKPTSVVAAMVTTYRRVSNQYVSTNPRDAKARVWEYPVFDYDLRQLTLPEN